MATLIWVDIGSGNGLLPDGTKAINWTNVDLSSGPSSNNHIEDNFARDTSAINH